ncbi:protein dispatched isoform X1 [Rhagoletis pomonella]|uniref:protein dispatched isoform X1 n=1 Tax=Rhagoletis pomonella TaxID=28610 RepID=UPI0017806B42|nr:protein dispatched isoform X1 [Rhagoletis pomonella]XP_036322857.1 protein dispatched isoform X1 [Rhagoletis pomonella]
MYMHWYYNFLVRRPYLMVLAVAVLCTACITVSLTMNTAPDFTDPTLGFETRGTVLGKRLTAWNNLIQETGPFGSLVTDPNDLRDYNAISHHHVNKKWKHQLHNRAHKRKSQKRPKNPKHHKNKELHLSKKISFLKNEFNITDKNNGSDLLPTQWHGDSGVFRDYEITNDSFSSMERSNRSERFEYGRNTTSIDEDYHREKVQIKKSTWNILKQAPVPPSWGVDGPHVDGYFCDSPSKDYSHFVVVRIGPNATDSLFDLNGLLSMCQLQNQIIAVPSYGEFCQKEELTDTCCRPWSIPNYAALLVNKSSCFDLNSDDVVLLQNLLVMCFEYYHDLKLSNDCSEFSPCTAPAECSRGNIVFNILHYLTDVNFIRMNDSTIFLKYAMIFVPVAYTSKILPLFHEWEDTDLKNELVQVVSMDLGLENELFNESLLTDVWLVSLGGIFVMTCIWLYTTSIFITLMVCVAVLFSLGLAYFVYTLVFKMSFFPYMNLLAVVVIIGIGADNAFLFVKIWQCVIAERFTKANSNHVTSVTDSGSEHTETLQNLMASTFHHSALSMFVSSLTTATAFFASYTSSITAIKCFGVFAGTVAITNYLLMITWLPAVVCIMERLSACTVCNSKLPLQKLLLMFNKSITKSCQLFEAIITRAVMNYATIWICLFGAIGLCSAIIVLYVPGLQLPDSSHFQLFSSSHPFEIYNSKMKNEFWFEKSMSAYENFKLPLRFVWGIQQVDDGDYTDPYSRGNLYYDNNFNISTKAAQIWLLNFCKKIRQQPFYEVTFGSLLSNCFIENFISLMERMCIDGMDNSDRTPCCDVSKFPFEPHVFDTCLPESMSLLYATPRIYYTPGVAGPRFLAEKNSLGSSHGHHDKTIKNVSQNRIVAPPKVKALVIEFESNVAYTTAYNDVRKFVQAVDQWLADELKTAPPEMQGGWFTSELKFFDTQNTLSHDTLVAIIVAMSASLFVLLLVTLNVLVSLYAVITVLLTIFTTVSILILVGWKLNVLESITVSTAIGLAVDFSLHYGIHYRMSPTSERLAASQFTLSRIVGPMSMAAITTGVAGALMLASNVLPYIQIGLFLVIVMIVSWLYGTFFLMSLLRTAGPQYGFMQFSYPLISKGSANSGNKYYERKQSQVIASEQLLTPSSSAIGELISSETHELESLTSSSLIKTISGTESSHPLSVDFEHSFNNKPANTNANISSAIDRKGPSIESSISELHATN